MSFGVIGLQIVAEGCEVGIQCVKADFFGIWQEIEYLGDGNCDSY